MFYIIIGQSGGGKTTFTREHFLKEPCEIYEDIIPLTRSGDIVALGKYGIGKRTEGTDTLRLRPFIIGCSEDYPTLIRAAKEAGADSVTTEFFCMESRADDRLKARYAAMSEVLGYDIHQFYMENSKQQGYKRLNRAIKAPIIHRMRELTHSLGMRFHVSDAFCRECNDACNCCGVPPEWGVSQTGNIGNAIIIAREKGFVTFSDVMESINKYFDFPWVGACGYNTGSNKARALLYDTTMSQWLRSNWNDTKKGTSPARAYGGVLVPDGKDENGDVIYRYAIKR